MVIDLPVAQNMIAESFSDLEVVEEDIATGEQYGIAVSKDNPGLLAAINEALAAIEEGAARDGQDQAEVVRHHQDLSKKPAAAVQRGRSALAGRRSDTVQK